MKLRALGNKFRNEWLLCEVHRTDRNFCPCDVTVLAHSKLRKKIYALMLKKYKGRHLFTFFNGKVRADKFGVEKHG